MGNQIWKQLEARPPWALLLLAWLSLGGTTRASDPVVPDDWAFRPVVRLALPESLDGSRIANPIDALVRFSQARHGIKPAPEADRSTLIRRLSFDLTGLPPTPESVEAFVQDHRPDGYAHLVDRLLAAPEFGERWARHWLDVVRFGESQGFEYDRIRDHAWRYRDYVIRAFNSDKPYDEFVREQLAGDVLEPVTAEGLVATGFLVAGPWDQAGNSSASATLKASVREAELEDVLGTVGQTFLGVTLNCARCHNHKFDPVPQKDYFRVKAVFQGIRHGDRSVLTPSEAQERERVKATQEARLGELGQRLAELDHLARERWGAQTKPTSPAVASAGTGPAPLARWTFKTDARDQVGELHGELLGGARIIGGRLVLDGVDDVFQSGSVGRELGAKTLEVWVALATTTQRGGGVLTLETPDGRNFDSLTFAERQPAKWMAGSEFYRRTRDLEAPEETANPAQWICLTVVYQPDHSIALYRNGALYGASYRPHDEFGRLNTFPSGSRILMGKRHTGAANAFWAGEIEEARLYDRALTAEEVATSFQAGPNALAATRTQLWARLTLSEQSEQAGLRREQEQIQTWLKNRPAEPLGYIANAEEPGPTFVLHRGEADQPREQVTAAALSAVTAPSPELGIAADASEGERRQRFADWVVNPGNPLTARVIVNRVWQYHFGRGLVATPNDFGKMGERPSHPELLDWLASWFVEPAGANWSLKRLHRLLVMSETWRQSSGSGQPEREWPKGIEDAENRWLGRFSSRRLEAEAVRDAMLVLGGELNGQMGGPGFRPFTYKGNGGQNEYFAADLPGATYSRRTVYRMCVHSARDPMLDSLDCPEFSTRTPVRPNTTTPLQALSLMNNPFVQRMAEGLARRIVNEAGTDRAQQVDRMWFWVFGRVPSAGERQLAKTLVEEQGLSALAWTLLNSNEFVVVR